MFATFQPAQIDFNRKPPPQLLSRLRSLVDAYAGDDLATTEALCCRVVGDFTAGIVLHRLLYWLPKGHRDDGAIWKADREWYAELNLSYAQMQRVRGRLKPLVRCWVEQARGAPTYHYRLRLGSLLRGVAIVLNQPVEDVRAAILGDVEKRFSAESRNDFRESRESITDQHQTFNVIDERLNSFHPHLKRFVGFSPEIAARLAEQAARLGESRTREVLARCVTSAGKTWQYVLRALENTSAPLRTPIPLFDSPPHRNGEGQGVGSGESISSPSPLTGRGAGGGVLITDAMRAAWAASDEGRAWAARLEAAKHPKPAPLQRVAPDKWQQFWDIAYSQLEIQLDRASFDTWLRGVVFLGYADGVYTLGVRNPYARENLQHRLYREIRRVLGDVVGDLVELRFELHKPAPDPDDELPGFKLLALLDEAHEAEQAFYRTYSRNESEHEV